LILSSSKGKSVFVRELLAHGADPNAEDNVNQMFFFVIFCFVKLLSFVNVFLKDNWTSLLCAAKAGSNVVCIELLNHGANIEHRDMVA